MKDNRKGLAVAIIVLIVGASVVTVVGGVSYRMNTMEDVVERTAPMDLQQHLYVTVTTDKNQYYVGETVKVTVNVTNIGGENVTVYFPDAQTADFKVFDDYSALIYLWSHDKCFAQMITPVTIPAGQSVNLLTDYWEQVDFNGNQVPCGGYRIDGYMVCYYDEDYNKCPEIHGNIVCMTIRESIHDVGVKEITEPSRPFDPPWPAGEYSVEAVVKNYGAFNETDFNVNAKIWELSEGEDDELYYEDNSLVTTSMGPGDEVTIAFTEVVFPDINLLCGHIVKYRMEVTTELSGDEVSDNDQKVMFFSIFYQGLPPYPVLDGTWGENGWYISCVTITFIDRDPYDDYVIYDKLNDGEWQVYDEPFIVYEDGRHTLYYYSIDSNGNVEHGDIDFKIDQTDPTIELTVEKIGSNTWLFIADVFDETSGVNRVEFYIDGEYLGTVTESPYEWEYSGTVREVSAVVYDNAGNLAIRTLDKPVFDNIKIEDTSGCDCELGCELEIELIYNPYSWGLTWMIRNVGDSDCTNVNWSITFDGGFILLPKEISGTILCIPPGENVTVSTGIVCGFGKTVITVSVESAEAPPVTKEQVVLILLFWIVKPF